MKWHYKEISIVTLLVIFLLIFRGYLNYAIPLMDKTEARYAEIARIMYETNDWITLQIDYGVSFWAKPPLSTWLTAISFKLLGVHEFSSRLPYLMISIGIVLMIGKYAKREGLPFLLPGFIILTIPEFLIHVGVVSTDVSLTFSVVLVMVSYWETMRQDRKNNLWSFLFFIGIGLGMLSKGPIIIVLTLPPIILWLFITKKLKEVWSKFPIVLGSFIVGIIAIPWFYIAEIKTPGFFDYFIIGEHFKRFIDSEWKGDKYGFPKSQPLGMVWFFLLVFAIPWIQILIIKLWNKRKEIIINEWKLFLLLWLIWTPVFFTISKSLIHPYIMPVMVPIALLIISFWKEFKKRKNLLIGGMIFPMIAFLFYIIISQTPQLEYYINSDKYLIKNNRQNDGDIFHWEKKSYSGQFYTKGKLRILNDLNSENNKLLVSKSLIIIPHREYQKLTTEEKRKLRLKSKNHKKGIYLYQ